MSMTYDATIPPPGWYYADGDPLGTHRYWDGGQWVGGPQAVNAGAAGVQIRSYAGWGERFVAWFVDTLVIWIPYIAIAGLSDSMTGSDEPDDALVALSLGWMLLAVIGNRVIAQGITGQTIGKKLMNIQLINDTNGQVPGVAVAFGRSLVATLFTGFSCWIYFLLDYLWPLWDDKDQRLTDKMFGLAVIPVVRP